ncbi:MAG TPA: SCO family protein [Verrucomicrobiae bacterium]|nr:SCO family protein [Verrucomicrobiae bacterium]
MSQEGPKIILGCHRSAIFLVALLVISSWVPAGCAKRSLQQSQNARRYPLIGTVVSVNKDQNTVIVDGQAIPGFMDAMTMPYPVHDPRILEGLQPGDQITGDVIVGTGGAYLQNIAVMQKSAGIPATSSPETPFHAPQPGEVVPDFTLTIQDGKRIQLNSFRGHVLMVTFIYTRCPFPTFCPLVSQHFADIYAATKKTPRLAKGVRLLTITFDPVHDTPPVLRRYGESFRGTTGGTPFDRWTFAATTEKELPAVGHFFGLTYSQHGATIVHSMSTTVIGPDGKVEKWYDNNSWQPADLVAQATQLLDKDEAPVTASHTRASKPSAATGN